MNYSFEVIMFTDFVVAVANSSMKSTKSTDKDAKNVAQSIMNNNFYAGPNCKKIEQELAEIKAEIWALKGNQTGGSARKG